MFVSSFTLCFVALPFALVDVAISVDESALTVGLVTLPVPNVLAAVLPDLSALSFSVTLSGPLAVVDSPVIKLVRASVDYCVSPWRFDFIEYKRPQLELCGPGDFI